MSDSSCYIIFFCHLFSLVLLRALFCVCVLVNHLTLSFTGIFPQVKHSSSTAITKKGKKTWNGIFNGPTIEGILGKMFLLQAIRSVVSVENKRDEIKVQFFFYFSDCCSCFSCCCLLASVFYGCNTGR